MHRKRIKRKCRIRDLGSAGVKNKLNTEMGITWCRERVEQAQNSKSPVDRILVRCSNMVSKVSSALRNLNKQQLYVL